MTNPAAELHAAAEKLRTLTNAVPPAPWTQRGIGDHGFTIHMGDPRPGHTYEVLDTRMDSEEGRSLAAYIAAMGPTVGLALADWLEATASSTHDEGSAFLDEALAVARAVNTGSQP